MLISFLLARKLKGKIYVLLMTVVLILVSLFSIGFPSIWGTIKGGMRFPQEYEIRIGTIVWQGNLPTIPLSFPFYASISKDYFIQFLIIDYITPPPIFRIRLYFLAIQIWTKGWGFLTSEHIILLVSFFLIINLLGALLGYWISKTTFIDKLLKKG